MVKIASTLLLYWIDNYFYLLVFLYLLLSLFFYCNNTWQGLNMCLKGYFTHNWKLACVLLTLKAS